MKREELTIDFMVYEEGNRYLGTTSVTLPNLSYLITEMSGAGVAGKMETIVLGHLEAMTTTINMRTLNKEAAILSEPRKHTIELRQAVQENDTATGAMKINKVKHTLVLIPKTLTAGTVQPAAAGEPNLEFATHYWKESVNGEVVREIDPLNYIFKINGVDYLEEVKDALGM